MKKFNLKTFMLLGFVLLICILIILSEYHNYSQNGNTLSGNKVIPQGRVSVDVEVQKQKPKSIDKTDLTNSNDLISVQSTPLPSISKLQHSTTSNLNPIINKVNDEVISHIKVNTDIKKPANEMRHNDHLCSQTVVDNYLNPNFFSKSDEEAKSDLEFCRTAVKSRGVVLGKSWGSLHRHEREKYAQARCPEYVHYLIFLFLYSFQLTNKICV